MFWVLNAPLRLVPTQLLAGSSMPSPAPCISRPVQACEDGVIKDTTKSIEMALVTLIGRLFFSGLNEATILHRDRLLACTLERPAGTGLMTVMNHTSTVDLPFTLGALMPNKALWEARMLCWTLAALDMCFRDPFRAAFFSNGRLMPVDRHAGIEQPMLGAFSQRLANGEWVHVFPEGRVSRDGEMAAFRRGAARVLYDAYTAERAVPIVLPLYQDGSHLILGVKKRIPRIGNKVGICVGEPIDVRPFIASLHSQGKSRDEILTALTDLLFDAVKNAREELRSLHSTAQ